MDKSYKLYEQTKKLGVTNTNAYADYISYGPKGKKENLSEEVEQIFEGKVNKFPTGRNSNGTYWWRHHRADDHVVTSGGDNLSHDEMISQRNDRLDKFWGGKLKLSDIMGQKIVKILDEENLSEKDLSGPYQIFKHWGTLRDGGPFQEQIHGGYDQKKRDEIHKRLVNSRTPISSGFFGTLKLYDHYYTKQNYTHWDE